MLAGRAGDATDIAGPCIMLASAAGAYINNATIVGDITFAQPSFTNRGVFCIGRGWRSTDGK